MARRHAEAQARSILLNLNQEFHLRCLDTGIEVPGLAVDSDGFYRIGYYVAGMQSAWVQQSKMRKAWPNLETKVVNVRDQPCEWVGEIWAKKKGTGNV